LSDFFAVWMKRAIPEFDNYRVKDANSPLTPKFAELTATTAASEDSPAKDKVFFEEGMASAFGEGRRILSDDGIGCVVFAHKTTEGWESLLGGILAAKWVIYASWPINTEQGHRLNARENASLGTSVHLVCRPRPENAEIGDWTQVSRELPRKVGDWMQRLQSEGVRGADLVFACIGPALEIYSRYAKVVDAQDREIPLGGDPTASEPYQRGYLAYVWEVVGRLALEQVLGSAEAQARNGNAGALEEDSRLTALFLWTMQSANNGNGNGKAAKTGKQEADEPEDEEEEGAPRKAKAGHKLIYDVVRRFAQPLGIHLEQWEGRIIDTEKGIVRLMPVAERARQLFGEEGAQVVAYQIERDPSRPVQMSLFPELESAPRLKAPRKSKTLKVSETFRVSHREPTTLDRLHAAMLLQKGGQTNALRMMLKSEVERSPDFLRLANALSALYPRESEEKRLLDAMLQAIPR